MSRLTKVACSDCGTILLKRNMKKHQGSDICQSRQVLNMVAKQNQELAKKSEEILLQNSHLATSVQILREEVKEMATRPQTVINNTTVNQFIIANKEPLSLTAIEASIALGMQASVLRDGAQGIAQYVVTENDLPTKIHISDKQRCVAKYTKVSSGHKVVTDKGCEEILNHIFVKYGRDGEIVVDRLSDELEKYMTQQNEDRLWPDEFYDQQMTKLGRLRLEWKKASEGHDNKLRKDVAKAIVRRCQ